MFRLLFLPKFGLKMRNFFFFFENGFFSKFFKFRGNKEQYLPLQKGLTRSLDPTNITNKKRKRQDKFCKFKIENNFSNIPKPNVQSSPEKENRISLKNSKEMGLMRGLDPSNVIDTKRKRQDQFCKLKMKPIVQQG